MEARKYSFEQKGTETRNCHEEAQECTKRNSLFVSFCDFLWLTFMAVVGFRLFRMFIFRISAFCFLLSNFAVSSAHRRGPRGFRDRLSGGGSRRFGAQCSQSGGLWLGRWRRVWPGSLGRFFP